MARYCILVEYDGSDFCGWQKQENGISVQALLEDALYCLSGERVHIYGAGRTDSGVHALGQCAHFDLCKHWELSSLIGGLNYHLSSRAISVLRAECVGDDFHVRFSAVRRHYLYRFLLRETRSALEAKRFWHLRGALNISAMNRAAQHLIGKHDFTTFRSVTCQSASPVKTLDCVEIRDVTDYCDGSGLGLSRFIDIHFSARSFLQTQVRSMVGALKKVGEGAWCSDDVRDALLSCSRSRCPALAPAHGLYLVRVDYK